MQRWPAVPTAPKVIARTEPARDGLGDLLSDGNRAGERDEGQPLVLGHAATQRGAAAHEAPHAVRVVRGHRAVAEVLHRDRAERGPLRRLPEDRVTADGGDGRVPRPHRDREVEGGDDADRAERVPLLHHPVPRPLRRDGQAVELAAETDREVADVDHLLHLAQALAPDLAHLERDELAERLLVLPEQRAELADHVAPRGRRSHAPLLEARRRPGQSRLVVGLVRAPHRRQPRARTRVEALDRLAAALAPPALRAYAACDPVDAHVGEERARARGSGMLAHVGDLPPRRPTANADRLGPGVRRR